MGSRVLGTRLFRGGHNLLSAARVRVARVGLQAALQKAGPVHFAQAHQSPAEICGFQNFQAPAVYPTLELLRVDQGFVAKTVSPHAHGTRTKQAIDGIVGQGKSIPGKRDQGHSAGGQNPSQLIHHLLGVIHVLQHIHRNHQIKSAADMFQSLHIAL